MRFLVWLVVNAGALTAAIWLLHGITLGGNTRSEQLLTLVCVALIFGLVNAVVRPVVKTLALPFIILTLGLLILVINAAMLLLTSWVSGELGLGFHVQGFWDALVGGIIVMVAAWVLEAVLPDGR